MGPGSGVRVQVPEYGSPSSVLFRSRFPSTGPGSQVRILNIFLNIFANLFKNALSFIFGLILDAVLVCYVIWVVGFQFGLKKIGSSQIYGSRSWTNISGTYGSLYQANWLVCKLTG